MNESKTGFKSALSRLLTPEVFANTVLPVAGIIESIVSRGASPGTVAMNMRQNVLTDVQRQREQEQADWERKQKEQIYADTTAANKLSREASQLAIEKARAEREREEGFTKRMAEIESAPEKYREVDTTGQVPFYGKGQGVFRGDVTPPATIPGGMTEDERAAAKKRAYESAYPKEAADALFTKEKATPFTFTDESPELKGKTAPEIAAYLMNFRAQYPTVDVRYTPSNIGPRLENQQILQQPGIEARTNEMTFQQVERYNKEVKAAASEAGRYMRAALEAAKQGTLQSDNVLVKALEKQVQDGAVMQGESDAYRVGQNFFQRLIANKNSWDAVNGTLRGELSADQRKNIYSMAKGLYDGNIAALQNKRGEYISSYKQIMPSVQWDTLLTPVEKVSTSGYTFDANGRLVPVNPDEKAASRKVTVPPGSKPDAASALRSFATEEEALKSGVKGTVLIAGRKAVID